MVTTTTTIGPLPTTPLSLSLSLSSQSDKTILSSLCSVAPFVIFHQNPSFFYFFFSHSHLFSTSNTTQTQTQTTEQQKQTQHREKNQTLFRLTSSLQNPFFCLTLFFIYNGEDYTSLQA
jgi:hypothetical protein